jgi:hypothetical protein
MIDGVIVDVLDCRQGGVEVEPGSQPDCANDGETRQRTTRAVRMYFMGLPPQ